MQESRPDAGRLFHNPESTCLGQLIHNELGGEHIIAIDSFYGAFEP